MRRDEGPFDGFVASHGALMKRCEDWVEELERVYPVADAMVTLRRCLELTRDGQEGRCMVPSPASSLVLRVFDGTGWIEGVTNRLELAEGQALVDELLRSPRLRPSELCLEALPPLRRDHVYPVETAAEALPVERKLAMLGDWVDMIHGLHASVTRAEARWVEEDLHQHFVGRGRVLSQRIPSVEVGMTVYVREGDGVENAIWGNRWPGGVEVLEGVDPEEEARQIVDRARSMFRAEPVPPGMHVIVTAPGVSGTIAHEAFGHGVEGDSVACGCSRAHRHLGKAVASRVVTLVDSPRDSKTSGHYFFDDEGVDASRTVILDKGILVGGISDRLAAARLGWKATGNGRRAGLEGRIFSRMSNTFIEPGKAGPEDLIGQVDRGIYLSGESGGQEDPLCWGIQVNVRRGEEIRDGQRTGRIFRCPVLTGFVPDVLSSVRAVGNDLAGTGRGNCGKTFRKDWVKVTIASPSLLLEGRLS